MTTVPPTQAPMIQPVTDEDVRIAWRAFFARPTGLEHVEVLEPEQVPEPELTLDGLKRVLEADRRRIVERSV